MVACQVAPVPLRMELGAKACQTWGTHPIQSSGRAEGWLPLMSPIEEQSLLVAARS